TSETGVASPDDRDRGRAARGAPRRAPAAVLVDALPLGRPSLRDAADDGEARAAAARRRAGGVEHGDALLPERAPRRLRLRSRHRALLPAGCAGRASPRDTGRRILLPSAEPPGRVEPAHGADAHPLAPRRPRGLGRAPLRRAFGDGPASPIVVLALGPRCGRRSLLSLRGEQSRFDPRPPRLS